MGLMIMLILYRVNGRNTGLINGQRKKYRLNKWNIVCRPKDQGGLEIEVHDIKNRCLLSKWLFKLLSEEGVQ
jgi:hypothetical protein